MRKLTLHVFLSALILLLAACGDDDDKSPPQAEVTNNSFTQLSNVTVGGAVIDHGGFGYTADCIDCATPFETVPEGSNQISINFSDYGSLGPFSKGKLYTVNVKKPDPFSYCAELWTHNDPQTYFSVDRTGVLIDSNCMSNATLNGTYVINQFGNDPNPWSARKEFVFNGNGYVNWSTLSDSNGSTASGSTTYTVAMDGTLTFANGDRGHVSTDGLRFSTADTDNTDNTIHLMVGMKKGSTLNNGTLIGSYIVNQFGDDTNPWTARMLFEFDGSGSVT
ncbi:MAG: hypothetical protein OEV42_15290 [Deltaproteobacteria bacterium]|nr:hypothetical protein [Deltaproteobacteria bacterium]